MQDPTLIGNPVAETLVPAPNPLPVLFGLLAFGLVTAIVIKLVIDLHPLRYLRRRHRIPDGFHLDPETIPTPVVTLRCETSIDCRPFTPGIGMVLSALVFTMCPFLLQSRIVPRDAFHALVFGSVLSFLVCMHLEMIRRPEKLCLSPFNYRIDPRAVTRPKRRLSLNIPERHPWRGWAVGVGGMIAILSVAVVVVLFQISGDICIALTSAGTIPAADWEARFGLAMFVLFVGMFCAAPIIDKLTDRLSRRRRVAPAS